MQGVPALPNVLTLRGWRQGVIAPKLEIQGHHAPYGEQHIGQDEHESGQGKEALTVSRREKTRAKQQAINASRIGGMIRRNIRSRG